MNAGAEQHKAHWDCRSTAKASIATKRSTLPNKNYLRLEKRRIQATGDTFQSGGNSEKYATTFLSTQDRDLNQRDL
jgi:hypothetical protein